MKLTGDCDIVIVAIEELNGAFKGCASSTCTTATVIFTEGCSADQGIGRRSEEIDDRES
jgi:Fe-S cluster biogenesis protein NfuA